MRGVVVDVLVVFYVCFSYDSFGNLYLFFDFISLYFVYIEDRKIFFFFFNKGGDRYRK